MLARDIANPVRGDKHVPISAEFRRIRGILVRAWRGAVHRRLQRGIELRDDQRLDRHDPLRDADRRHTAARHSDLALYHGDESCAVLLVQQRQSEYVSRRFRRAALTNSLRQQGRHRHMVRHGLTQNSPPVEYSHGINFLPFTGGSAYLGRDTNYCRKNWAEMLRLQGVSTFDPAKSQWADLMEEYEAFFDPTSAIEHWNKNTHRVIHDQHRRVARARVLLAL